MINHWILKAIIYFLHSCKFNPCLHSYIITYCHFHLKENMFREKIMGYIPLIIPSFFLIIVCVSLTFDAKSILTPKRSTYIVYMDKSLMPKAFTSPHSWYSSIIDSFKFTNLESPYSNLSSSPSFYTLMIMLFMVLVFLYLQMN